MDSISIRKKYKVWGVVTLVSVYLLILVGGIVRSTGSGMGCPDWPKCFAQWIPPTDVSQLSTDYKEIYSEKRRQKNIKIARVLYHLNFIDLSKSLLNDTKMYHEFDFNATKTWIEYLNRLFGVLVGIFIAILAFLSFKFIGLDNSITLNTVTAFVLVGLEGWIGSIVVSTNLLPFAITIHMFLALLLIGILIKTIIKSQLIDLNQATTNNQSVYLLYIIISLTFIQILLGSQVRESIDEIAIFYQFVNRNLWINELGTSFYIHRSFSILILILNLSLLYKIQKQYGTNNLFYTISLLFNVLLWVEVSLGVYMAYFSIPPFSQPLHLFIATLIFGLQFSLLTLLKQNNFVLITSKPI